MFNSIYFCIKGGLWHILTTVRFTQVLIQLLDYCGGWCLCCCRSAAYCVFLAAVYLIHAFISVWLRNTSLCNAIQFNSTNYSLPDGFLIWFEGLRTEGGCWGCCREGKIHWGTFVIRKSVMKKVILIWLSPHFIFRCSSHVKNRCNVQLCLSCLLLWCQRFLGITII